MPPGYGSTADVRGLRRRRAPHPDGRLPRRALRGPPRRPRRPRRSAPPSSAPASTPSEIADVYFGAANQSRRGQPRRRADGGAARRACRRASPGRPSTGSAPRGSRRSTRGPRAVKLGEGDFYLAGGVESMSRAPWVVAEARARAAARRRRRCTTRPSAGGWSTRGWPSWRLDRVDGRDRRERRRALRGHPRGPGRLRPAQPPARGRGGRGRALRRGDRRRSRRRTAARP